MLKTSSGISLYVALIHYPVVNKNGEVIASAVTNLDLHDIARASKTYGVIGYYVVTPLEDQKALVEKIISHWVTGVGAAYNPVRREALELIRVKDSVAAVIEDIRNRGEGMPKTVVTSAREYPRSIGYETFREMLETGSPYLLNFGTAWGLSESLISEADYVLNPIKGKCGYNHLSVRSAVSVILDRLMGVRSEE
ncbi:MAG: hypothetical protein BWK80_37515 [Desulfobacteraceae bacterium IS3]|nr:MAG: hypothetical protein BWK80_37515 [Desulfobacteraceae bacterium IS3]